MVAGSKPPSSTRSTARRGDRSSRPRCWTSTTYAASSKPSACASTAGSTAAKAGSSPARSNALAARSFSVEIERGGVDAVAQTRRRRAVREDMAEVAAAAGAQDLGAHHAVRRVNLLLDRVRAARREERGPATARVVLRVGAEELGSAPCAAVRPRLEDVVVLARE